MLLCWIPGDYHAIQDAINAASDNDTVLVHAKTEPYRELITFDGRKTIIVISEDGATIDGDIDKDDIGNGSVVTFVGGDASTLDGFSIINGILGIYCKSSSPTINNCTISYNSNGGILFEDSKSPSPVVSFCSIINNSGNSVYWGYAGIKCKSSSPSIINCITAAQNE